MSNSHSIQEGAGRREPLFIFSFVVFHLKEIFEIAKSDIVSARSTNACASSVRGNLPPFRAFSSDSCRNFDCIVAPSRRLASSISICLLRISFVPG